MPPLGGDRRGLQAARPASGDHDAFRARRPDPDLVQLLSAGLWPLDAGDRVARVEVPDAGLTAADARPDTLEVARGGEVGHLGVAYERASHADGVGVFALEDQFRVLWLIDPPSHDDRDADPRLDFSGHRGGVTGVSRHRRHDVVRAGQGGRSPGSDGDIVEQAFGVEDLDAVESSARARARHTSSTRGRDGSQVGWIGGAAWRKGHAESRRAAARGWSCR